MSLNKITDSSTKKQWMNINCNDLKTTTLSTSSSGDFKTVNITNTTTGSAVYLVLRNDDFPPDERRYGYYSGPALADVWFAKFDDTGAAIQNYICYQASGGVSVGPEMEVNNGIDMMSSPLSNVGSSIGSFYEEFTSSGNTYTGIWASPQALEYKLIKIGNTVSVHVGTLSATATIQALVTGTVPVPARFRPSTPQVSMPIRTLDNGASNLGHFVIVGSTGAIFITSNPAAQDFSGVGSSGWADTGMSYVLN